jgi:membrane protein involved in colicin uptake
MDATTGSDASPSEAQKRREAAKAQLEAENAAEDESAAAQDQVDTLATSSLSGTTAAPDDGHDEEEGIPRPSEDTLHEHEQSPAGIVTRRDGDDDV